MENQTTNQLIILAWRWDTAEKYALDPDNALDYDRWYGANGAMFIRTAVCAKHKDSMDFLASLAGKYLAPNGRVLYMLHETSPHFYENEALKSLVKKTKLPSTRIRARLFGGGNGPVYFGPNSKLGVLGLEGNFPVSLDIDLPEGGFKQELSGFVIDPQAQRLCDKHLDYLWACYWNRPFEVLRNLAESFELWALGFDAQEDNPPKALKDYLALNPLLWHKLAQFAERADLASDPDLLHDCAEYRATNHCSHLGGYNHHTLADRITQLSAYTATILDGTAQQASPDVQQIHYLYHNLIDLVKELPPEL